MMNKVRGTLNDVFAGNTVNYQVVTNQNQYASITNPTLIDLTNYDGQGHAVSNPSDDYAVITDLNTVYRDCFNDWLSDFPVLPNMNPSDPNLRDGATQLRNFFESAIDMYNLYGVGNIPDLPNNYDSFVELY